MEFIYRILVLPAVSISFEGRRYYNGRNAFFSMKLSHNRKNKRCMHARLKISKYLKYFQNVESRRQYYYSQNTQCLKYE